MMTTSTAKSQAPTFLIDLHSRSQTGTKHIAKNPGQPRRSNTGLFWNLNQNIRWDAPLAFTLSSLHGRPAERQHRDMTACMAVPYGPWVERWLSPARFATYLRMAGHDRSRALALYEWSTSLNAALLHDFAHLEVGLRNMYDAALMGAVAAGDSHWFDRASADLLFPRTVAGNARTHRDIATARDNAGGTAAPAGKMIAELSFGFWVFLTARRHEPLVWLPHLAHAYPSATDRTRLHSGLSDLVKARNRVAHHEPATVRSGREIVRRILGNARYVAPELAQHIDATSTVERIIQNRP